ncbi:MAG: TaqI-like C-terminal specificity domain-containing protein [Thermotogota bacterium]|nr:TaqI-like C-terminal specificity domain-containing protein [Thermotogota bacterium]
MTFITVSDVSEKEWHFSAGHANEILSKLRTQPRTLSDVCEKIFQGIATSADKIYFLEHIAEKDGVITAYSKSLNKEITIEKGFVKPLLKGADVHRYLMLAPNIWNIFPYKIENGKAILYSQNEIKKYFPMAWKYLLENRKELENRERGRMKHDKFYAYIYPKNLTEFEREKIVTPDIASMCQMSLDDKGIYHTTTIYSFAFKRNSNESMKYYLALLNSKLLWYFVTATGSILRGNYFRFKTNYLMPFPIPPELSNTDQQPFVAHVDQILSLKKSDPQADTNALENEIDQMVYKLYGLTEEEIAIVEGED